jgi:hypothetical protein
MTSSVWFERSRAHQHRERRENDMTRGLAWIAGLGTAAAVALASGAGVWLTDDLRLVGVAIAGIMPIAAALVGYFEWRANLRRSALAERADARPAA